MQEDLLAKITDCVMYKAFNMTAKIIKEHTFMG